MDGFQILLIAAVLAGVALVILSFFIQSGPKNDRDVNSFDGVDRVLKAVDDSVTEADNAAEELHKLAGSVTKELDNKYQELLFLYNLIDEKKKELYDNQKISSFKRDDTKKKPLKHPKQQEILALVNEGATVPEIAKKLGMGQGEVNLILDLGNRSSGGAA